MFRPFGRPLLSNMIPFESRYALSTPSPLPGGLRHQFLWGTPSPLSTKPMGPPVEMRRRLPKTVTKTLQISVTSAVGRKPMGFQMQCFECANQQPEELQSLGQRVILMFPFAAPLKWGRSPHFARSSARSKSKEFPPERPGLSGIQGIRLDTAPFEFILATEFKQK